MEVYASISVNSTCFGEAWIELPPEIEVAYQLWLIAKRALLEKLQKMLAGQ
jgi:hypothetical protein